MDRLNSLESIFLISKLPSGIFCRSRPPEAIFRLVPWKITTIFSESPNGWRFLGCFKILTGFLGEFQIFNTKFSANFETYQTGILCTFRLPEVIFGLIFWKISIIFSKWQNEFDDFQNFSKNLILISNFSMLLVSDDQYAVFVDSGDYDLYFRIWTFDKIKMFQYEIFDDF